MLRWFVVYDDDHVPSLKAISDMFQRISLEMDTMLMESAEKTTGMRKLLEAKDCFDRAALETDEQKERDRRILGDDGEVH